MPNNLASMLEILQKFQILIEEERKHIEEGKLEDIDQILQQKGAMMAEFDRLQQGNGQGFALAEVSDHEELAHLLVKLHELQDQNVQLMREKMNFARKELTEMKSNAMSVKNYAKFTNVKISDSAKFFDKKR